MVNKYNKGVWAEELIKDKLAWKIGRKIIRHTNYDEYNNETWQCVVFPEKFLDVDEAGVFAKKMREEIYGEYSGKG